MAGYRNLSLVVAGELVHEGETRILGYFITNQATSARYIKFYDRKTPPNPASDVPKMTWALPGGSAANLSAPFGWWEFHTGLWITATTGIADTDTGAPAANDVVVNLEYQ